MIDLKIHVDTALRRARFFAVLEIPPVKSATDALRALIVAAAKKESHKDETRLAD